MTKIERGWITWIQNLALGIFVKDPLLLCALDLSSAIKTGDSDSRFLWQYIGTIFSPLLRLPGGGWDMGQRRWMRWMRMRWMSWMRQGAEHQAQVTLGVSRSITSQPNASQEVYVCQPTVQPSCIKTSHKSVCEQSYKMKYVKVSEVEQTQNIIGLELHQDNSRKDDVLSPIWQSLSQKWGSQYQRPAGGADGGWR